MKDSWEIKEFYHGNKDFILTFIVVLLVCAIGVWVYCDNRRNEPVYENTNNAMADVEGRISSIEQRIDRLQDRLDKAEKTVSGTIVTIRDSRENAVTVADGIDGTEARLNDAIQRSGRIQNLIADIENANQQGKKNP